MKMPSTNPYGLNNFLHRWAKDNPPKLPFKARTKKAAQNWKKKFKAELKKAIGPMPKAGSLRSKLAEKKKCKGYTLEKRYIQASPWHKVPTLLLIPDGAKNSPVVVALHGHGRGKIDPASIRRDKYFGFAVKYAQRGFVVALPDFFPFGERMQLDHSGPGDEVRCNARLATAMLYGFTTMALNISDVMRVIDYVGTRPEADIKRLGCMGLSYGGTVTMYTTVLDRRIKRAVLGCSFGAIEGHGLFMDELCGSQVVPGIMRLGNMAEVAGCIAPRPLLLESARKDYPFPWAWTKPELSRLRNIYETLGAADKLQTDIFDGGHQFYGDNSLDWFNGI